MLSNFRGPLLGITTASTSTKVSLLRDELLRYARELAGLVADPNGQWEDAHQEMPGESFRLVLTPGGLAVYEEKRNKARLLPRKGAGSESWLTALHDHMCPKWVLETMARSA